MAIAWLPFLIWPTPEEKPHIKLINGIWYCAGAGRIRDGFTAEHAFRRWEEA